MKRWIFSIRYLLISICILVSLQWLNASQVNAQDKVAEVESIQFKDVPIKLALSGLAHRLNIIVEFDDPVEDKRFTIDLKDITERRAFEVILTTTKLKGMLKEDKVLFIFVDTPENRKKYSNLKDWNS